MKCVYTIICLLLLVQAQATVRRVRAGNTTPGNGSTWAVAYNNLQTAINASSIGDEVWVAVPIGTAKYQPASGGSFSLRAGVKIYGGFNGTETALINRNFTTNVTTLQGNGNSVIKNENDALIGGGTQLDGFTVTGGNNYFGGGIYCGSVSPSFSNLIIKNNIASNSGGGVYVYNGTPSFNNCIIVGNNCSSGSSGDGGGIYNDNAYPVLTNCAIANNFAGRDGGGVYSYESSEFTNSRKPTLTNCVIAHNEAGSGAGGGIFGYTTSYIITNCTIFGNTCYLAGCGAGIHNYSQSSSQQSNSVITNCIFWLNRVGSNGYYIDLWNTNVTSTVTYSMLVNTPAGAGNVGPSTPDPFLDGLNGDGNDDIWMTADDGFRLSPCKTPLAVDKGSNAAIGSVATDILGNPRKVDNGLIADGGSGTAPVVDMGAYEEQTTTTPFSLTGSIGNAHTVPHPQELPSDAITSTINPASGTVISWQKNEGSGWVTATPASSAATYPLPNISQTTLYRRMVTSASFCNTPYYSNEVQIKVANPNPTGAISGKVTSNNGTGVQGIVIRVTRLAAISGSPAGYTYTDTTDGAGDYSVSPIYYGDPDMGQPGATFSVSPYKANHVFDIATIDKTISEGIPQLVGVNFKDNTVISITGRTFQLCTTCTSLAGNPETQTCPIDSIRIFKDNSFITQTRFIDTAYGRYGISVTDPVQVRIEPRFTGHTFSPVDTSITPLDNVRGVDFRDVTIHTISGKLTAGCNNYIGQAVLEFSDVLQDADGNARTSCFRKRVTTNLGSGTYSITLPARKYTVRVVSFTPSYATGTPGYVNEADVRAFFNNTSITPADSLKRDITNRDTTLNLVYVRPPQLSIIAGLSTMCNGQSRAFSVFKQGITDSFTVKAFQGASSLGCPVTDTSTRIKVSTSIQAPDATNQELRYRPTDSGVIVKLKGGTPNIITPYYKILIIQFQDRYGRSAADTSPNVVVTGVKTDVATYTTVSPEIPMLILHDPPGDRSKSFWQQNQSIQTAFRMYTAKANSTDAWLEAKIGTKVALGLGVSTETSVWGTIGGGVKVESANTTSNETVLSTTTSLGFSTSDDEDVTGGDGDLYVGAALNIIYAGSTEIKDSACQIRSSRKLTVGNDGFATQYVYDEKHIRDIEIPTKLLLAQNPGNTPRQTQEYLTQASVWQQVLDNNAANKARATFDKNISFSGSAGPIDYYTTSSVSNSNTVEFSMVIDAGLALGLGFEIAGSGLDSKVTVNFKTETGESSTTNLTNETTIGYTLDDGDAGDYFSVNIKKDPVYSTPVFELAAGTSSCPVETGTQPRDEMQLTVPVPTRNNVPANQEALFTLKLGNTSQSGEARNYVLKFDQSSNPNGAEIKIGGSPVDAEGFTYLIGYLGEVEQVISVKKSPSSSVFSYEGLKFILTDKCGGDSSKTAIISANFVSPCSGITLAEPENGWLVNSFSANTLNVLLKDYTVAGLSSITQEYSIAGTSNWVSGFTLSGNQINNSPNGTSVPWNIMGLADGAYNIRLKLTCGQGVVYSQRASGIIDRKGPGLFGNPQPTDDNYVAGDIILFSYTEKLLTSPDSVQVTMRRKSNNQLVPVSVTSYENKIIITPNSSITSFINDTMTVIVAHVADQYGNLKAGADTTSFVVGTSIPSVAPSAATIAIQNPVVYKNSDSTIKVLFKLREAATDSMRINYSIGGTARLNVDYRVVYTGYQPAYAYFNGSQGAIRIARGDTMTMLKIDPIGDSLLSPDKTIIINLSEGGSYTLGAATSVTGSISSEDGVQIYTFTGNGNFNIPGNWLNGKMPLTTLASGKQIIINPSGTCTLNTPLTVKPTAVLRVKENKQFIIQGSLKLQ